MKNNILIVEDHELTRFGLRTTFSDVSFIETIFEAESAEKAFEIVANNKVDLIIMDLGLPNINGIEATKRIKTKYKDVKIVILTSHDNEDEVLESLKAGANAYCSKEINPKRLVEVVSSVFEGASWFDPSISSVVLNAVTNSGISKKVTENDYNLTSREAQILKLITLGYNNNEIAKELVVSVNTTKAHVANILQKLEVEDRLQAAVKAINDKIV